MHITVSSRNCHMAGTQQMAAVAITTDFIQCELSCQYKQMARVPPHTYFWNIVMSAHTGPPPAAHITPGMASDQGPKRPSRTASPVNGFYIVANRIHLLLFGFLWRINSPPHLVPGFGPHSTPAKDRACDPNLSPSTALFWPWGWARDTIIATEMQQDVCLDGWKTFSIPRSCKSLEAWSCCCQLSP